ncbi:Rossmann-fold NAD(P)-binding domain-containing protein [Corallococcus sp. M7]
MKVIIFGATGMVGAGALREALNASEVESVLSIGRQPCGVEHPKLRELLLPDLFEFAAIEDQLVGYDACIWAIGVSSVGLDEAAYARLTEELTLVWARALLRINPGLSFCYCSAGGAGGRSMWARVRQRVEGALKSMPFRHAGAVRPAFIRAGPGIRSRTRAYQVGVVLMKPLNPLIPFFIRVFPSIFTTSEILGRAMLRVVEGKADRFILESTDINRIGA